MCAVFDSTLITIKSFNLSLSIVKRKNLFTFFKDEKKLLLKAIVLVKVKIIESILRVLENAEGSFDKVIIIVSKLIWSDCFNKDFADWNSERILALFTSILNYVKCFKKYFSLVEVWSKYTKLKGLKMCKIIKSLWFFSKKRLSSISTKLKNNLNNLLANLCYCTTVSKYTTINIYSNLSITCNNILTLTRYNFFALVYFFQE